MQATCHPELGVYAKGLCGRCYHRQKAKTLYHKTREIEKVFEYPAFTASKFHDATIKTKYGLTSQQYWDVFVDQGKRCAVCGRFPKTKRMAVDHRHSDGLVRGLLCWRCNYVIGMVDDNTEILERMRQYLLEPSAVRIIGERHVPVGGKRRGQKKTPSAHNANLVVKTPG